MDVDDEVAWTTEHPFDHHCKRTDVEQRYGVHQRRMVFVQQCRHVVECVGVVPEGVVHMEAESGS